MKALNTLFTLALSASPVLGHWNYNRLIVNGEVVGEPYQYIRQSNNSNNFLDNVNSTDMRCNAGGGSGAATETYAVNAGDEVGFGVAETFGHPGIQQVYLSAAPGAAAAYDGAGDWARVYSLTTNGSQPPESVEEEGLQWATHKMVSFYFTLPEATPAGEYLLRSEGIALHAAHKVSEAQFYVACAQIRVVEGGNGTLGPLVQIPGWYTGNEPGVLIPEFWSYLRNYTTPGPALWPEGVTEQHELTGEYEA